MYKYELFFFRCEAMGSDFVDFYPGIFILLVYVYSGLSVLSFLSLTGQGWGCPSRIVTFVYLLSVFDKFGSVFGFSVLFWPSVLVGVRL